MVNKDGTSTMDNATLYNCCTDCAAPDWSLFDNLELGGCKDLSEEGDDDTYISGGYSAAEADFFTIYGHLKTGGCEAITDCKTFDEAVDVGLELTALSGLRVFVVC